MFDVRTVRTAATDAGLTRCPVRVKHVAAKKANFAGTIYSAILIYSPLNWMNCNSSGLFEVAIV
jgi:hypothetical protein